MNISNYFWYFESAIPPRICDLIVKYGKAEKEREVQAVLAAEQESSQLSYELDEAVLEAKEWATKENA